MMMILHFLRSSTSRPIPQHLTHPPSSDIARQRQEETSSFLLRLTILFSSPAEVDIYSIVCQSDKNYHPPVALLVLVVFDARTLRKQHLPTHNSIPPSIPALLRLLLSSALRYNLAAEIRTTQLRLCHLLSWLAAP